MLFLTSILFCLMYLIISNMGTVTNPLTWRWGYTLALVSLLFSISIWPWSIFFLILSFICMNVVFLRSPEEIVSDNDFEPQQNLTEDYDKFKMTYPHFEQHITESLKLDVYNRDKVKVSYEANDTQVLLKKYKKGAEAIRKGAYGILLLTLHERGLAHELQLKED